MWGGVSASKFSLPHSCPEGERKIYSKDIEFVKNIFTYSLSTFIVFYTYEHKQTQIYIRKVYNIYIIKTYL